MWSTKRSSNGAPSEHAIRSVQIGMTAVADHSGGVDRYYNNLIRELPAVNVGVAGLVVTDRSSADDMASNVRSFASENENIMQRWRGMRRVGPRLFREADLIVSHFAGYAFPVLDATVRRPLVVHFHGPWALESRAEGSSAAHVLMRSFIERAVYSRARRFIVLSAAFADVLSSRYGVAREKIDVIHGGVDLSRFRVLGSREDARERLGWPTNRPIVATVRRLVPSKGIENLIDAVRSLRATQPDVLVQIVGTGPLEADLMRQIRSAGLEDHVHLAGFVSDENLPYVYRGADLFVVPTVALEGFGLVVVESLACGTPALVTPVGGLPEVVRELDPALVLEGTTVRDIAAGLERALSGEMKLPSETACIAYARRFGWPHVAELVARSYRAALL